MTPKNFLVTGAGRGIGRGLTRLLLAQGHRVFLLDNNEPELTHTTAKLSQENHIRDSTFQSCLCDIRQPAAITTAIASASAFFHGHLDVLIHNAAHTSSVGAAHLSSLALEDWNAAIETNLTAPMLVSQACLPLLQTSPSRARGGVIVHLSSTRAFMAEPDGEPYAASKAGLRGLSQSLAVSLAPQGVRVNAILPGWIHVANECKEADERGQSWEEGLSREDHAWHLTGRVGKVEDVLKAVEYLVENEGVSGSELVVDGGVTRKMVYPEE